MKTKIRKNLQKKGFHDLLVNLPGINAYVAVENGFLNAIVLADLDSEPKLTREEIYNFIDVSDWKAPSGERVDTHVFLILASSDMEKAREYGSEETFCWYIDTESNKLVIDNGKAEDFYGLKGMIETALNEPDEIYEESDPENSEEVVCEQPTEKYKSYVSYALLILNTVLYIACVFAGDYIYDKLYFDPGSVVYDKQWYRFITGMFLHGDVYHLSGNMIYLYLLGNMVEKELGSVKYFILYFLSGIAGSYASFVISVATNDLTPSLGASGAIFGITAALLWIVIRNKGRHEVITIPKIIFLIAYSLYNGFISSNVDNAAHIGGLMGGFVLAILLYRKKAKGKERGSLQ